MAEGEVRCALASDQVVFGVECGGQRRATRVAFSATGDLPGERAGFDVHLGPRQRWDICVDVSCAVGEQEVGPRCGHGQLAPQMPMSLHEWLADAPSVEADDDTVEHTYRQSLLDLAALRFRPLPELDWSLPAAGLPWFMALFGRDSLLTAYMALPFQPRLAASTLRALAALQSSVDDAGRDAEPGKILHELRRGRCPA